MTSASVGPAQLPAVRTHGQVKENAAEEGQRVAIGLGVGSGDEGAVRVGRAAPAGASALSTADCPAANRVGCSGDRRASGVSSEGSGGFIDR